MNDLDFMLYYFKKYESEREKMSIQELNEIKKEIQMYYERLDLNSYNNESQIFINDLYNTVNKSINKDVNSIDKKINEQNYVQYKKEVDLEKGEINKERENDLVDSLPGSFLLGPLTKGINKFV